ncbi:hypothetical protein LTR66_008389 [Elasticomyces elasticus]|nr:hypothetical protein LTR66_008389 [Elasticomyces elasticus]
MADGPIRPSQYTMPSSSIWPDTSMMDFSDHQDSTPASNGIISQSGPRPSLPPQPTVDALGRTLNPRSCVTCRKRKVKCDKLNPCSNCNKAHIECVFPAPGRAPRKARKSGDAKDAELLARLRRLEGVVKGMGVDVPVEQGGMEIGETNANGHAKENPLRTGNGALDVDVATNAAGSANGKRETAEEFQQRMQWAEYSQKGRLENKFGRLVVNEGRSRYINNSFWANLSNEVEDLKGILNEDTEDEEDESSPGSTAHIHHTSSNHHGWIFSFNSQKVDMLALHPIPSQIQAYWKVFKERVDPLVKVLHVPTTEPVVLAAASHLANLSKGFEALLFAIYYGAATSLLPEECWATFGEEKGVLLARYRFAIEQALARANFLTTEEIIIPQAFVIFLICLRRNNDARVIWTLTGLVVRIAQTIGVHRDGTHFGLSPFEIEMRRRLWWQVCILDTRASEDHGCDPTILEQAFDTKMPLNVNDTDLDPKMTSFPPERQGCTDITFCLIRFEFANTFRRINYIPPGPPRAYGDQSASVGLTDKERWITECHARLEERYLANCDMSVPLYWVTATVARLMMAKMWLMVYHPFQRQDGGASLPPETKDKLFITSLENIEYSILLETESRTIKWGWLFKTYMQWHALAFLLSELCHRTTGDIVERAWQAVDKTREGRWGEVAGDSRSGHLWKPLRKLLAKAKAARAQAVHEESINKMGVVLTRTYSPNQNSMFGQNSHGGHQRPLVTRAPLSQAQLDRFRTTSPTYGSQPINATELLKSPRLEQISADDPMDLSGLPPELLQNTSTPDFLSRPANNTFPFTLPQPQTQPQPHLQPRPTQTLPQQQWLPPNSSPGLGSASKNSIPSASPAPSSKPNNTTNHTTTTTFITPTITPALTDPANYTPGLSPFLDSDLNWENWDDLVRRYGVDVGEEEAATVAPTQVGALPGWAPTPQTWGGPALGMGMAMRSSDWF